jgi:hypothetical protein
VALTDPHTHRPALRDWFDTHFPEAEPLQQAFREQVAAMPARHDRPRRSSPLTLALSGAGFEHRIRYLLDNEPPLDVVTRGSRLLSGAATQAADRRRLEEVFDQFLADHRARIAELRPATRALPEPDERRLAADCVVLGMLEQPARVGDARPAVLSRHLSGLHRPDDLLAVVPPEVIDDMIALSTVAIARLSPLRKASDRVAVAGTGHLEGANADMIIGDLLLELRISMRPALHREWLYHLLGAVLLDHGVFEIRSAGFYLPRQDALVTWPVEELISTAAGDPDVSVDRARQEFHALVTAEARNPQQRAVRSA